MGQERSVARIVLMALVALLVSAVDGWALHCPEHSTSGPALHTSSAAHLCAQQTAPAGFRSGNPVSIPQRAFSPAGQPAVIVSTWSRPGSALILRENSFARQGVTLYLKTESFLL